MNAREERELMTHAQKNDTIMRLMAKMACEEATMAIAKQARTCAATLSPDVSGTSALIAFATAIESTCRKQWPTGDGQ